MSITPEAQVQPLELGLPTPKRRITLKFPGQVFGHIDACPELTRLIAHQIQQIVGLQPNLQLIIVVGGSNFGHGPTLVDRGASLGAADRIGMGATILNGIMLEDQLRKQRVSTKLFTSLEFGTIDRFSTDRAEREIDKGKVLVLAGGLGHGSLSSSFAAVTLAHQLDANELVIARIGADGIFDRDPADPQARLLNVTSHDVIANMGLNFIDEVALKQASTFGLPIRVFGMSGVNPVVRAIVNGEGSLSVDNPFDFGPTKK